MKRNFRVIQINGIRGLLMAVFVGSCLLAGFVAFPALLVMNIWNYLPQLGLTIPSINFVQGLLLWAIIIFSYFLFNKKKFIVSFKGQQEISDAEINEVISKIKAQTLKHQVLQTKELKLGQVENSLVEREEEAVEAGSEKTEV